MTDLPQSQSLGSKAVDSSVKYHLDLHKGLLSIIFHLRQAKNTFKDFFFPPMDETSLKQKVGCWASEFASCGEMTLIHIYWWEVRGGPAVWLLSSLREGSVLARCKLLIYTHWVIPSLGSVTGTLAKWEALWNWCISVFIRYLAKQGKIPLNGTTRL